MTRDLSDELFEALVDNPEAPGGLSETQQAAEPGNFLRHILALSASKVADGLLNPKLVLSWLLEHLDAGALWTGLLVPVREAGALLPQLFTAGAIHGMARRKWAWAAGSAVQGIAAGGIVLAALTLQGNMAGAVIVALLAVLALARSVCSVSYKDVLGKTVGRTRRGTATGAGAAAASVAVIGFAALLMLGLGERIELVLGALVLAAVGWGLSAVIMASMREEAQRGDARGVGASIAQLKLLRDRPQLLRFVAARSALVGTALAPPYLVLLASGENAARQLGALVLASAVASLLSSYVWGRLSDRSSRRVLIYAGLAGAAALALALVVEAMNLAETAWAIPGVLFVLMVAYHGVRRARSTYLVDMAPEDERPTYTAVTNTAVGVFLLIAGAGAAAVAAWSVPLALGLFLVMTLWGAWLARGLDEVEDG
ncbi:MFS transporter [Roseovarius sp. SCSIO 43702]|uniref:MFS transporter n=1 Tax=Roseovarius sp. SCSIO 43702 TaxID=2823043 RepID=UPI001C73774D|nr:MFS transporter [Roseovarius sp. SCSIO 43702]QYX55762.1 MFS transporter [Roseovarius sp. SCSIO 43702]